MKRRLIVSLGIIISIAAAVAGCSKDAITDSLSISYGNITVGMEKKDGKQTINANITVKLLNRTEQGMNVAFIEGTFIDAKTKQAIARFRPIIPQSYGTISSAQLLPKQKKDVPVITPPELEPFNSTVTSVIVKISFQATDGYRTEVASAPIPVNSK